MSIARATTPTFTLTFTDEELDLTQVTNVYVTFEQGKKSLTKTGSDLTVAAKQIEVYLNQSETLQFGVGIVKIQANWTMAGGRRASSNVVGYHLTEHLLEEVVE